VVSAPPICGRRVVHQADALDTAGQGGRGKGVEPGLDVGGGQVPA
jgi:hypothetical protein